MEIPLEQIPPPPKLSRQTGMRYPKAYALVTGADNTMRGIDVPETRVDATNRYKFENGKPMVQLKNGEWVVSIIQTIRDIYTICEFTEGDEVWQLYMLGKTNWTKQQALALLDPDPHSQITGLIQMSHEPPEGFSSQNSEIGRAQL